MEKKLLIFAGVLLAVLAVLLLPLEDGLEVEILKVGKADAMVLRSGGETLVLDTGEEEDGQELVDFLTACGIQRVDVLIITHFDKDHVGGAPTVLESIPVDRVIVPAYEAQGKAYIRFQEALKAGNLQSEALTEAVEFPLGEAKVLVEPPEPYPVSQAGEEIDNDSSLLVTVTHREKKLLFAADALQWRLNQWLSQQERGKYDFLKVPHHGRDCQGLEALLDTIQPACAAICCSEKNPPDPETLELLESRQVEIYLTKDGNITIHSDGKKLKVTQ